MSVNFTPGLEPYKTTGSFKFWCQKVLPLVYDDSLSYYELLCKVVNYLNDVISNVDGLKTDVDNLVKAYDELQDYVNNYFDNIDVQTEINNKLDSMVEDGTLGSLISDLTFNPINVYYAGIHPNTGEDLTTDLQTLFNNNPNKWFYFPAGTYNVNGNINIPSSIRITLSKNAIIQMDTTNAFLFTANNIKGIIIEGGTFNKGSLSDVQNREMSGSFMKSGIAYFEGSSDIKIENVIVEYNSGYHCFMFKDCKDCSVNNISISNFFYNGVGFIDGCENVEVCNSNFANGTARSSEDPYSYGVSSGFSQYETPVNQINNYKILNCSFENMDWEAFDCHGGSNISFENISVHNAHRICAIYPDDRPIVIDKNFKNAKVLNLTAINDDDYTPFIPGDASIICFGEYNNYMENMVFENIHIVNPFVKQYYGLMESHFNRNMTLKNWVVEATKDYPNMYPLHVFTGIPNLTIDNYKVYGYHGSTSNGIFVVNYCTGEIKNCMVDYVNKIYTFVYFGAPCKLNIYNITGNLNRIYYAQKTTFLQETNSITLYNFPTGAPTLTYGQSAQGYALPCLDTDLNKVACTTVSGSPIVTLTNGSVFAPIGTGVTITNGDYILQSVVVDNGTNYIKLADNVVTGGSGTIHINRMLYSDMVTLPR